MIDISKLYNFSANERTKGEGKGKEEEGTVKGKGKLEVKLWQKREKIADAPAGNRTRDPSKPLTRLMLYH